MKRINLVTLIFLLGNSANLYAKNYIGKLSQPNGPRGEILIEIESHYYGLQVPSELFSAVSSLVGKAQFVEIDGTVKSPGHIEISQVPTITSGDRKIQGLLVKRLNYNGPYPYEVNGTPVKFGNTKIVNGAAFDEKSMTYYEGKEINGVGSIDSSGAFVIQSVMRSDVLSVALDPIVEPGIGDEYKSFAEQPFKYVGELLHGKGELKSPNWFKGTLFADPSSQVKPGDSVLIITVSGREGDSMGAVNGHFSTGIGQVGVDGQVSGEMFNVYVTNEKEIVPGNIDITDYFGHLISGQSNYRPTYTLMFYGISKEKILQVKAELDRFHPVFRDTEHPTKITCVVNCATLSVQALADIDFHGVQRNVPDKKDVGKEKDFVRLSQETNLPPPPSIFGTIGFLAKTKRAEFMPGPALLSILNNLPNLAQNENLGIKRADFIYGGQTPSARPVGKNPSMGIRSELAMQAVVGTGLLKDKVTGIIGGLFKRKPKVIDQCEAFILN